MFPVPFRASIVPLCPLNFPNLNGSFPLLSGLELPRALFLIPQHAANAGSTVAETRSIFKNAWYLMADTALGGTLDGSGHVWYDQYAADSYTLRPVLVGIDGLKDSVISDLVLRRHSPQYYHFISNSSNVVFNNIDIAGASTSNNTAKYTDGWDTYRSKDVAIMNSVVKQ
jgi:hypothetical protein